MTARKIEVVDHDPTWADAFARERAALLEALGDSVLAVEHVGSTAVPGLAAKPVLDLLLEVSRLSVLDARQDRLVSLGYVPRGENGIPGRRYFVKGGVHRTHHLHAFERGDPSVRRHLAFRDHLIEHKGVADAYGALKRRAAAACKGDPEAYARAKRDFVERQLAHAMAQAGDPTSIRPGAGQQGDKG